MPMYLILWRSPSGRLPGVSPALTFEVLGQRQSRQAPGLAALGRREEPQQQRVAARSQGVAHAQADADGLGVVAVMANEQRRGAGELVAILPCSRPDRAC